MGALCCRDAILLLSIPLSKSVQFHVDITEHIQDATNRSNSPLSPPVQLTGARCRCECDPGHVAWPAGEPSSESPARVSPWCWSAPVVSKPSSQDCLCITGAHMSRTCFQFQIGVQSQDQYKIRHF